MFEGCVNLEHIYGPYVSDDENGNPIYTNLVFTYVGNNFAKGCVKLKTCLLSSAAKNPPLPADFAVQKVHRLTG